VSRVESVEETLAGSDGDGVHPEVELVDEVVLQKRAVELAGAVLQDVPTRLFFQLGDGFGHVSGVPMEYEVFNVFRIREGRISEYRLFLDRAAAIGALDMPDSS
jgi:hypothetical protein